MDLSTSRSRLAAATTPGFGISERRFNPVPGISDRPQSPDPGLYDVDKATSMARQLEKSPIRLAVLRSKTERFASPKDGGHERVLGPQTYDIHPRYSGALAVLDIKRTSAFRSTVSRFSKPKITATESSYGPEFDEKKWVSKGFAVSRGERFSTKGDPLAATGELTRNLAPYDVEKVGSLARSVEESPVRYATLRSKVPRFPDESRKSQSMNLGPGDYDISVPGPKAPPAAASAFKSSTRRFRQHVNKIPDSNFTFAQDRKSWTSGGFAFSTRERFEDRI